MRKVDSGCSRNRGAEPKAEAPFGSLRFSSLHLALLGILASLTGLSFSYPHLTGRFGKSGWWLQVVGEARSLGREIAFARPPPERSGAHSPITSSLACAHATGSSRARSVSVAAQTIDACPDVIASGLKSVAGVWPPGLAAVYYVDARWM